MGLSAKALLVVAMLVSYADRKQRSCDALGSGIQNFANIHRFSASQICLYIRDQAKEWEYDDDMWDACREYLYNCEGFITK